MVKYSLNYTLRGIYHSIALIIAVALFSSEENLGGTASKNTNNEAVKKETDNAEESNETSNDINQVIVDNENVKATLVKIIKKTDDMWGDSYEVAGTTLTIVKIIL